MDCQWKKRLPHLEVLCTADQRIEYRLAMLAGVLGEFHALLGAQVAQQIQDYAAGWARMIANPVQEPGYRAQRDAYCQRALQSQP